MFARFFIDRPVFAWVISIVIVLFGFAAYFALPVAQFPEITPPTVQVTTTYPGASAQVVADTVAAPIEQQVIGVERALYMSSTSANDGSYNLTVTFKLGTDLNIAQVLVQNRVAQALPKLPPEVQLTGVVTKKRSPAILLVVDLTSDKNPQTGQDYHDRLKLSNFATIQIKDKLAAIDGVGDVTLLGQQDYSMRIWVDPEKLASRKLTATDVVNCLKEQNVQVAAGAIGQPPIPKGQEFQFTLTTLGRLKTTEEFEAIVLRRGDDGSVTYVRDVGRAELGAQNQNTMAFLDGRPTIGLAAFQLPGSNALQVGEAIKKKMAELAAGRDWPVGLKYSIDYDTTPFIEESVQGVIHTLLEAIVLVAIVVLLFLQDWKAVLLPLIDVFVSLIGTLAILYLMGFTLNTLTLFGLVLAIGIVVDDAIVVLENIERWMAKGYAVREATIHAMDEITGPILGITLVLCSVFIPSAFLPGITGQFFRQFALTIAASMLLSATNAMTMTPARAASIFGTRQPGAAEHEREALPWWLVVILFGWLTATIGKRFLGDWAAPESDNPVANLLIRWALWAALFLVGGVAGWLLCRAINRILGAFFRGFNRVFDRFTKFYGAFISRMLRVAVVVLVVYAGLLGLTYFGFTHLPTGFIPEQDQGYLIYDAQLEDAASLERTAAVAKKMEEIIPKIDGVAHLLTVPGQSFVQNAISPNFLGGFIPLKPFDERTPGGRSAGVIAAEVRAKLNKEIVEARFLVFGAPAIQGLGNTGGFKLMVEDQSGTISLAGLQGQADNLADKIGKLPGMAAAFNSFRANTPQLYVEIDRVKAKAMGVPLNEIFGALQVYLGGFYVNDFNVFGRTWQVNIQAEPPFRVSTHDVTEFRVRNSQGEMVPLGSVLTIQNSSGPVFINRYNNLTAATINAVPLPGTSTGNVIRATEALARTDLRQGLGTEWTELTYLEQQEGSQAILAFVGAVLLVFLVLAALYESWSLPLAVILVVPMCLLCALVGIFIAHLDINIFVQVSFVVLVGLASKNAILVVEFARDQQHAGKSTFDAAVEASEVRLRPIIMTSFAFILGVVPLVVATGAGAEMRHVLGVSVFSGMLGVTLFGLVLTPLFYYVVIGLAGAPTQLAKPSTSTPTDGQPADISTAIRPADRH